MDIVNLSNSILKHFGGVPYHKTIPEIDSCLNGHKKVVVLLFDGFGKYIQDMNRRYCPFIVKNRKIIIDSTFPPTTVAATTAFASGRYPIETGWMSWSQYFEKYHANIEVFKNTDSVSKEALFPKKHLILDDFSLRTRIVDDINKLHGKTIAYSMEDIFGAYTGTGKLGKDKHILDKLINDNDELYLSYYFERPDHDIHGYGTKHWKVKWISGRINVFVKKLVKHHPDTLFITIADHGLIDVVHQEINCHEDLMDCLVDDKPLSFEKRCPTFFVKPEKKDIFPIIFKKHYSNLYDLYSKEEVLEKHIFGEGKPLDLAISFIGDFMGIAKTNITLKDNRETKAFLAKGRHGGGTKEEKEIAVSIYNR